jgi:hypothetical protein
VFPHNARPYGTTYPEWSARSLQWALSIPADQNPFLDPDGSHCQVGQSRPVFFLASNFGGTTVRDCTLPAGQSTALSPGGTSCIAPFDGNTEEELRACVEGALPFITNVGVDIDGTRVQRVESFLSISDLVSVTLPVDNIFGLPAGDYQIVSGGYFLIHAPLSPGQHVIHMHDEVPAFDLVFDVTYRISVAPQD